MRYILLSYFILFLTANSFSQKKSKLDSLLERETSFKKNKDDLLVLFTDGYADQFGGSNGKKLKSKAFKEQIAHYSTAKSSEVRQNIEEVFVKWKGSHEQVDDVLVVGIKI